MYESDNSFKGKEINNKNKNYLNIPNLEFFFFYIVVSFSKVWLADDVVIEVTKFVNLFPIWIAVWFEISCFTERFLLVCINCNECDKIKYNKTK